MDFRFRPQGLQNFLDRFAALSFTDIRGYLPDQS
jgi:hypothetical protein